MPTQEQFDAMNDAAFGAWWDAHVEAAPYGERAARTRARRLGWDTRAARSLTQEIAA